MVRILVIEDDPAQRVLVELMLGRIGYESRCASSGDEALVLLDGDSNFAAILSDVRMPGLDGSDLLQALQTRFPHIPIVAMTVHASANWVEEALRHGASACLAKPFFAPQLADTLGELLSECQAC